MAVLHWTLYLVVLTAREFFIVSSESLEKEVEVGNWTVGDCILAEFAMEFSVSN